MKVIKEIEFNEIISDILKNEEFIELRYENHHGISRLDHSLSVARLTYDLCHFFKLKNYRDVTRAALLHDFFKNSEVDSNSFNNHPKIALANATRNFKLNKRQKNIIEAHMFPAGGVLPKYKESWLVSMCDKTVAIRECCCYKVPMTIGALMIFFLNFAIIQR